MPTRDPVANRLNDATHHIRWTGLLLNDDGAWFIAAEHPDRTVQITGTFGGATLVIQGSNDPVAVGVGVPSTGFTLTDQTGAALSFTAAGGKVAAEAPRWVRPLVTGGDGTTSLTVDMVARR